MILMHFMRSATVAGVSRHSVIRSSLVVTFFFVAGQAFFYLLVFAANRILDPVGFGRFYTAWAALNVLAAPGSVLSTMLVGHFAAIYRTGSAAAVTSALRAISSSFVPWVGVATIASVVILNLAGVIVGVDALALTVLVPLTAAASFVVEMVRAAYQGMRRFAWFGASWFAWCIGQCVLGVVGLALTGAVWAAYAGMLGAGIATLIALTMLLGASARPVSGTGPTDPKPPRVDWRSALSFCTSFGGLVLFNNADIFVAYLTMDAAHLGAYAAAAVLPKAILTATQPIVQTIFPIVVHLHGTARQSSSAVTKAVGLALALASAGAVFLWVTGDSVCGGGHGIRFCSDSLMTILAAAAIPLAAVRVWTTADLGRHLYSLPLLSVPVFLLFMLGESWSRPSGTTLAMIYGATAWGMLATAIVIKSALWRRGRKSKIDEAGRLRTDG